MLFRSVETSFGKLRFYVNKWGTLRPTDAPPTASEEPAASSTSSAEVATSSMASVDIPPAHVDFAEEVLDEHASPLAAAIYIANHRLRAHDRRIGRAIHYIHSIKPCVLHQRSLGNLRVHLQ